MALLLSILGPEDSTPAVVPTSQGGLHIEWHRHGIDLEIESPPKYRLMSVDEQMGDEQEFVVTTDLRPVFPLLKRVTARN